MVKHDLIRHITEGVDIMARKKQREFPLLDYIKKCNEDAERTVLFFKQLETHIKELRQLRETGAKEVLDRCRLGSVLEDMVRMFWDYTDIPLSMAYWFTLGTLGGIITQEGKKIVFGDQSVNTNLWILAMAESAMGKTWTLDRMKMLSQNEVLINEAGYRTKPAMIADFVQNPGMTKSVLCIDEIAQTIKLFRKDSGADLKEAFLMGYDGRLSSTTKKDGRVEIKDIALTILACTVLSTFTKSLTDEDMLDGFLQRFLLIKAGEGERNMKNWPYQVPAHVTEKIQQHFQTWHDKVKRINKFYLTRDAQELWSTWYHAHFSSDYESYYKRYLWATLKMAAVFHTLGPTVDGNITTDDMGFAIHALDNSLESLYDVMDRHMNFTAAERTIQAVRQHIERYPGRSRREVLRGLKISKGELVVSLKVLRDRGQVDQAVFEKLASEK